MNTYPEHERMKKVLEESQSIGAFLDWLMNSQSVYFMQHDKYYNKSIESMLALYFGINLDKIEKEKLEMLQYIRNKKT